MELIDAIEKTRVDQVELFRGPRPRQFGSLVLTGHHLIFAPAESERNTSEFWLLHRAVDRVLVEATSNAVEAPALLHLKCKNFLICSFNVPNQNDCNAVARSIERLSNLNNIELEYPFYNPKSFEFLDDGWTAFDIDHTFAALSLAAGDRWRISTINKNFEVCPSYPERVIVPRTVRDDHLGISATYRDSSRFPVLAYFHAASQSSIMRCGQPLVSPTSRRCKEDESVLNALITPNTKGVIFDTRTEAVAVSARAKGALRTPRQVPWKSSDSARWHPSGKVRAMPDRFSRPPAERPPAPSLFGSRPKGKAAEMPPNACKPSNKWSIDFL